MSPAVTSADHVATMFARLRERGDAPLLATAAGEVSAAQTLARAERLERRLATQGIGSSAVCAFRGDYAPETAALFLALASLGAVAVPFTDASANEAESLAMMAGVEWWVDPTSGEARAATPAGRERHSLFDTLVESGHPGLIVFTSGSTGRPKAILHDVDRVASKFAVRRPGWRMVLFLLMDHFGGFNSLMSVFANDGVGVCLEDRSPRSICRAIECARAELLPTTPTFLGVLVASGLWREHDLSSIRLVTYGAEPMPATTLARARKIFPGAQFKQTYGLSEVGVLRSVSPDPDSLWLKVGGDGFETRIVGGELHIRSGSTMLGYLNAPSPIDAEGWMNTGDLVEEKDGLIRFLGRQSEVINVGGQKVLPTEVEDVLLAADGIVGAVVHAVAHPLLGQVVAARVATADAVDQRALADRLRRHCRERLQKYKVPMRFEVVDQAALATERAKKNRPRPA